MPWAYYHHSNFVTWQLKIKKKRQIQERKDAFQAGKCDFVSCPIEFTSTVLKKLTFSHLACLGK